MINDWVRKIGIDTGQLGGITTEKMKALEIEKTDAQTAVRAGNGA